MGVICEAWHSFSRSWLIATDSPETLAAQRPWHKRGNAWHSLESATRRLLALRGRKRDPLGHKGYREMALAIVSVAAYSRKRGTGFRKTCVAAWHVKSFTNETLTPQRFPAVNPKRGNAWQCVAPMRGTGGSILILPLPRFRTPHHEQIKNRALSTAAC